MTSSPKKFHTHINRNPFISLHTYYFIKSFKTNFPNTSVLTKIKSLVFSLVNFCVLYCLVFQFRLLQYLILNLLLILETCCTAYKMDCTRNTHFMFCYGDSQQFLNNFYILRENCTAG